MGRLLPPLPSAARRPAAPALVALLLSVVQSLGSAAAMQTREGDQPVFEIELAPGLLEEPFTGRALVFLSRLEREPRTWSNPARLTPVLAADFDAAPPGEPLVIDSGNVLAYPVPPAELEGGTYHAQAVLDLRREAPWPGIAAGNPCSAAVQVELGGGRTPRVRLLCDGRVPGGGPAETRTVRRVEVLSERLSAFHGRPVHLRALVHLPQAWFDEPERRFPLYVFVSGFGATLEGFRSVEWPAPPLDGEPFVTVYPDPSCTSGHSGLADSDNNGPCGEAFVRELLPEVERRFRGIGEREARVLAGHSSGGWAALWLLVHHPREFGAAWASSPDPVDYRDFMGVDLYAPDANLLHDEQGRPRVFCTLGGWTVNYTLEHARREEVLRGGVLGFFEALAGGRGADGRPRPLFDRRSGRLDPEVVEEWRRYDLSLHLREHWSELGPLLDGRIVITVGDGDNFLLEGSVLRLERELEALGATVHVHTLSGDHFSELDPARSERQLARIVDRFREWNARRE